MKQTVLIGCPKDVVKPTPVLSTPVTIASKANNLSFFIWGIIILFLIVKKPATFAAGSISNSNALVY